MQFASLAMTAPALTRQHRSRLMQLWRSAGWPCKDGLEIDLLAAGLLTQQIEEKNSDLLKSQGLQAQEVAKAISAIHIDIERHEEILLTHMENLEQNQKLLADLKSQATN